MLKLNVVHLVTDALRLSNIAGFLKMLSHQHGVSHQLQHISAFFTTSR